MLAAAEKYLVLCVDRDDDLGAKAGVGTPVVGRDRVLEAATRLALADPEEADANAMFAAVRKYDELSKSGTKCEVAVACGDSRSDFEADRTVGREVNSALGTGEFTGIVLVSDGGEDEQVIPVLQGIRPIVSVQRVTVKHSETVEETYQVLGRYLRMLVFDPRYSKWALGVPGLIFLLAGVLIVSGRVIEAELASLLIIGGAFFIRGFNVDRTVMGLVQRGPTGYLRLFSMVTSVLVVIAGFFAGYNAIPRSYITALSGSPGELLVYGALLVGYFIGGALALVWAGIAIWATGALLSHLARDSPRWRRDGFVLVMLALLYFPVATFSAYLTGSLPAEASSFLLISYVLLGLAAIFIITTAIFPRVRSKTTALS